jgi:hypothetical protein
MDSFGEAREIKKLKKENERLTNENKELKKENKENHKENLTHQIDVLEDEALREIYRVCNAALSSVSDLRDTAERCTGRHLERQEIEEFLRDEIGAE